MKTSSEFYIATTSDVHMGHPRVPTQKTYDCIRKAFPDNKETAKLDMLVIAGDFYDRLLNLSQDDVEETDVAIIYLLRLAAKHDIVLSVLKGTPSHDWDQSARFVFFNEKFDIGAKLYYFDQLCIHHFEEFNMDFLFVPDEWTNSTEKTLKQVRQKLAERGLEKVDYGIMHGAFDYQLPMVAPALKHDSQAYLELVRYLIFIGHIHTHSRFDRIIVPSSLNRLAQGEEGPKGHVRAKVRSETDYEVIFVENKDATIFKTIQCGSLDLQEAYARVDEFIKTIPDDSFIRIRADLGQPILNAQKRMEERWPTINWQFEPNDRGEKPRVEIMREVTYSPITITSENIVRLVQERFAAKEIDPKIAEKGLELLRKIA